MHFLAPALICLAATCSAGMYKYTTRNYKLCSSPIIAQFREYFLVVLSFVFAIVFFNYFPCLILSTIKSVFVWCCELWVPICHTMCSNREPPVAVLCVCSNWVPCSLLLSHVCYNGVRFTFSPRFVYIFKLLSHTTAIIWPPVFKLTLPTLDFSHNATLD